MQSAATVAVVIFAACHKGSTQECCPGHTPSIMLLKDTAPETLLSGSRDFRSGQESYVQGKLNAGRIWMDVTSECHNQVQSCREAADIEQRGSLKVILAPACLEKKPWTIGPRGPSPPPVDCP